MRSDLERVARLYCGGSRAASTASTGRPPASSARSSGSSQSRPSAGTVIALFLPPGTVPPWIAPAPEAVDIVFAAATPTPPLSSASPLSFWVPPLATLRSWPGSPEWAIVIAPWAPRRHLADGWALAWAFAAGCPTLLSLWGSKPEPVLQRGLAAAARHTPEYPGAAPILLSDAASPTAALSEALRAILLPPAASASPASPPLAPPLPVTLFYPVSAPASTPSSSRASAPASAAESLPRGRDHPKIRAQHVEDLCARVTRLFDALAPRHPYRIHRVAGMDLLHCPPHIYPLSPLTWPDLKPWLKALTATATRSSPAPACLWRPLPAALFAPLLADHAPDLAAALRSSSSSQRS